MHFCTPFLTRGLKDFKGQNLSPQVFDRSQILVNANVLQDKDVSKRPEGLWSASTSRFLDCSSTRLFS